jgi:hypothetical protein
MYNVAVNMASHPGEQESMPHCVFFRAASTGIVELTLIRDCRNSAYRQQRRGNDGEIARALGMEV